MGESRLARSFCRATWFVAKFAQENIAPFAEKIDRTNSFPELEAYSVVVRTLMRAICSLLGQQT
ncbi:hypothetical protein RND71_006363 [Anisodus tanguticus]|uniref:Uncharacterized protein n=1 Tax=Anisodus tanguticus TaxID=243964 RepID=A0AAE1VT52_9SOLA|nr:hypothetical protein RND71_006363 [Anisodus tanguticus]